MISTSNDLTSKVTIKGHCSCNKHPTRREATPRHTEQLIYVYKLTKLAPKVAYSTFPLHAPIRKHGLSPTTTQPSLSPRARQDITRRYPIAIRRYRIAHCSLSAEQVESHIERPHVKLRHTEARRLGFKIPSMREKHCLRYYYKWGEVVHTLH